MRFKKFVSNYETPRGVLLERTLAAATADRQRQAASSGSVHGLVGDPGSSGAPQGDGGSAHATRERAGD